MRDCDWCVHCAACLNMMSLDKQKTEREINVNGTENVMKAAVFNNVKKVIHISTENCLIEGKPLVNVDETYP